MVLEIQNLYGIERFMSYKMDLVFKIEKNDFLVIIYKRK